MRPEAARRFAMIVLAYLGPLAIIPLVVHRHGGEVRWHAWQGLLLAPIELGVVGGLTAMAGVTALSSVAGGITFAALAWILWLTALAVRFTAMLIALNGGRLLVPLVSSLASRVDARVGGTRHPAES